MKKIFALLLVFIMILSLSACGAKETADSPSSSPSASASASASSSPGSTTTSSPPNADQPEAPPPAPPVGDHGQKYGGTVRIVCTAEGAGPIGVPWEVFGVDVALLKACMEPIASTNAQGELILRLAEKYEVDMDNLTITWWLKPGIKFHDGSELNADVFVWNAEHNLEFYPNAALDHYEVLDTYCFRIHLKYFQNGSLTGVATLSLISKEAYEKNGVEWARDNPVGTGPFKLQEYVPGSHARFIRYDDYWEEGKPYLDGMDFVFIRDVMTQNVALQATGDQSIDILNTTSGEQIATLRDLGFIGDALPIGPISLAPNSLDADSPFAKLEVRQAVSYAINRDAIMAARGFGVMTAATQWVSEAFPAGRLDDSYNFSYNPEKAKELLTQAGYPNGFSTTLYAQPALADRDSVIAMQAMLAAVGIDAAVEFPDSGGYSAYRSNGWDGLLVQHTRAFAAMETSFWFYFSEEYNLLSRMWFGPEELQDLIEESRCTIDNASLLKQMHKIVLDNMLVIPIYNLMDGWVYKPEVKDGNHLYWGGTMFMPGDIWLDK